MPQQPWWAQPSVVQPVQPPVTNYGPQTQNSMANYSQNTQSTMMQQQAYAQPSVVQPVQPPVTNYGPQTQNSMANYSQNTQSTMMQQQAYAQPPAQVPSAFPGKFISSENDIQAKDVPMDAALSLFPSENYSYIIAKSWNREGTIDTVVYVPQQQVQPTQQQDPFEKINERLDRIEKSLNYRRKNYNKNYHQNGGPKKEARDESD